MLVENSLKMMEFSSSVASADLRGFLAVGVAAAAPQRRVERAVVRDDGHLVAPVRELRDRQPRDRGQQLRELSSFFHQNIIGFSYLFHENQGIFIFFHQISLAKYLSGRNIGIKFQLGKGWKGGLANTFVTSGGWFYQVLLRNRQWL